MERTRSKDKKKFESIVPPISDVIDITNVSHHATLEKRGITQYKHDQSASNHGSVIVNIDGVETDMRRQR